MNFLPAEITHDGHCDPLATGTELRAARPASDRPGHARHPARARDARADGIPLTVELVEPLGSETLVHGRMADGTPMLAKLNGAAPVGDAVRVALNPAELHVFDRESGRRL